MLFEYGFWLILKNKWLNCLKPQKKEDNFISRDLKEETWICLLREKIFKGIILKYLFYKRTLQPLKFVIICIQTDFQFHHLYNKWNNKFLWCNKTNPRFKKRKLKGNLTLCAVAIKIFGRRIWRYSFKKCKWRFWNLIIWLHFYRGVFLWSCEVIVAIYLVHFDL